MVNILGEKKYSSYYFLHITVALSCLNRKDIHNISLTCRGQLFNCHNWHPLCCGHWSVREVISTKFSDILYLQILLTTLWPELWNLVRVSINIHDVNVAPRVTSLTSTLHYSKHWFSKSTLPEVLCNFKWIAIFPVH